MPRITGIALLSAHGDLDATLAALDGGHGDPGLLAGDLLDLTRSLARQALAGRTCDAVILATTKGELVRWCEDLRRPLPQGLGSPGWLAAQIAEPLGCSGFAVSAACASGPLAVGVAARGLLNGSWRRVVVIGADRIGPFITEGFIALKATDPQRCRPFDAARAGLRLGELIAAVVLEAGPGLGPFLQGWAGGMDANHLTGPTRDGSGLGRTLHAALARAAVARPQQIIAHGTGTRYNDDSESLAYTAVCPQVPVTAWKGLLGHSLGACGVAELALAVRSRARGWLPGCANLENPGCAGDIPLLPAGRHPAPIGTVLLANAGFGGLNGATVLGDTPPTAPATNTPRLCARVEIDHHGWRRSRTDEPDVHGVWAEPALPGSLPRLSARCVLGHVEATWGRMDLPSRALVSLGHLLAPLPVESAIVLVSERGSAASDRLHDQAVLVGQVEPQRFPYTLPTTVIGEASIRLGIRGPGFSLHGTAEDTARRIALEVLGDDVPGVLIAWIEADRPPMCARAEWWCA